MWRNVATVAMANVVAMAINIRISSYGVCKRAASEGVAAAGY